MELNLKANTPSEQKILEYLQNNASETLGSWGSYNECNERALGSKWLDLSDYSDWDEIVEELKKEGFELDGIDEELFIQDVEGVEDRSVHSCYNIYSNYHRYIYDRIGKRV